MSNEAHIYDSRTNWENGVDGHLSAARALVKEGRSQEAIEAFLDCFRSSPSANVCVELATCYERIGDSESASRWAGQIVNLTDDYSAWQRASGIFQRCRKLHGSTNESALRVAVLGSYTTAQFVHLLPLALVRPAPASEIYESPYAQIDQEILDPGSGLYQFRPDVVVIVLHEGGAQLPEFSALHRDAVASEVSRWTNLWSVLRSRTNARVIQHNFAVPGLVSMGHLSARVLGSRYRMLHAVNAQLGEEAGAEVSIVDCERLAAWIGKHKYFDPRYWHLAKQAVALEALPLLVKHTAAVISASMGRNRKCLVLDLDNTLWGGVIGEDGVAGLVLGQDAEGEAYVAFQEYVLELKRRGVVLAVCSKNNHIDAIEPFATHPEMRLTLDDFAIFVANWNAKAENIRLIAEQLNLGLDALVFVDDNPVECAAVRQALPEVDVIQLPPDPADFVRTLGEYLCFESDWVTQEDANRTAQYQARAQARQLEAEAGSIEAFHRGLRMEALVSPFTVGDLPRIAQLVGKTNQFNLTTRRHSTAQLLDFMHRSECVHLSFRLRDRLADHGLVSVIIALQEGHTLVIDTWLMSCRVMGRTVDAAMLSVLCREAKQRRCKTLVGTYVSTDKNAVTATVYGQYGFDLMEHAPDHSIWQYDLEAKGIIPAAYIHIVHPGEIGNAVS